MDGGVTFTDVLYFNIKMEIEYGEALENRRKRERMVGVTGDNLHGNFYRQQRRGNIRQTRLRSETG